MTDLEQQVINVVAEQLGISKDLIKLDSNFVSDLGADSLDKRELVLMLDDQFNIEIPDEAFESLNTPNDVVEYISKLK